MLVQITMDLARAGRMLGMALILVASYILISFLVVRFSTFNNHKTFAQNKVVEIKTHNIITNKVLYS